MASISSVMKLPCVTCKNKNVGVFKCEGCSQTFCRKHCNEHRDSLTIQLDEIVHEHDTLQQTLLEKDDQYNDYHRLIGQINQWEKDSIAKIQLTAQQVRQQMDKLISTQTETMSSQLHDLAERLRSARVDDDFVETDLHQWTSKLQKLKTIISNPHPTILIREDPSIVLVAELNIELLAQPIERNESLIKGCGCVQIINNGRMAIQCELKHDSCVLGRNEYSFGKHTIKFFMDKKTIGYSIGFGIITKNDILSRRPSSYHGWWSDDSYSQGGNNTIHPIRIQNDMKKKTSFTIELILDCTNRSIQYFNQDTKNTRELKVDLDICPFPWQLFFCLYDVDDRIQLL